MSFINPTDSLMYLLTQILVSVWAETNQTTCSAELLTFNWLAMNWINNGPCGRKDKYKSTSRLINRAVFSVHYLWYRPPWLKCQVLYIVNTFLTASLLPAVCPPSSCRPAVCFILILLSEKTISSCSLLELKWSWVCQPERAWIKHRCETENYEQCPV